MGYLEGRILGILCFNDLISYQLKGQQHKLSNKESMYILICGKSLGVKNLIAKGVLDNGKKNILIFIISLWKHIAPISRTRDLREENRRKTLSHWQCLAEKSNTSDLTCVHLDKKGIY